MNMNNGTSEQRPKIKVILVDDSQIALTLLKKMLLSSPDIEVVGTAMNGREALELIPKLDPTVVCTDLHMPAMDGLELTREIMARYPKPILVISASVSEGRHNVFHLMEAGAVDVLKKPRGGMESEYIQQSNELINRGKILAGVHVFRRVKRESTPPVVIALPQAPVMTKPRIVSIGASTGGPQAFQNILSQLPAKYPFPIICVQHIGDGFMEGLVEWFDSFCAIKVELAQDGAMPLPGVAYFPREGSHLLIDSGGRFKYSLDIPFSGHRPSITVTFKSVAERYGSSAIGVLLTGMGNDGAEGLKAIADMGGITIAQDETTSIVFGMPKVAAELGAARHVLPLDKIAPMLVSCATMNGAKIQ